MSRNSDRRRCDPARVAELVRLVLLLGLLLVALFLASCQAVDGLARDLGVVDSHRDLAPTAAAAVEVAGWVVALLVGVPAVGAAGAYAVRRRHSAEQRAGKRSKNREPG